MKILQLCKKFPFPLKDGESIAITNLSKALQELGCEVTLLSMNTKKHFFDTRQLPSDFNHYRDIHTVEVDNELNVKDALLNLFKGESYHISRFVSDAFTTKLKTVLQRESFDIVQLETLYLAPYIPVIRQYCKDAVISMRAHNVEHEIWERIASNTGKPWKKWYLGRLTEQLKTYEVDHLNDYDILVPITDRDLRKFKAMGYRNGAQVTPIGINQEDYQPNFSTFDRELSISFIGSLDWMPNQEGLRWFIQNVWHKAVKRFPKLTLHVAGRKPPEWITNLRVPNVKVYGEVPDAAEFINQHSIMVVPLLSGSGMRAKILEGMALGKVVLTTAVGLEGISARHKREVLVADTVEEFLSTLAFCYEHPAQLKQMAHRAHDYVSDNYDRTALARRLAETYKEYMLETVSS